jgi:hypothetical protein
MWQVRGDYNLTLADIADTNLYGLVGMVEKAVKYEVGIFGNINKTNTAFDLWLKGQANKNDNYVSPSVSSFDFIIGTESEHIEAGANIWQQLGGYLAIGLGITGRVNTDEDYGNRDFTEFMANIDVFNVIPNNYFSITTNYFLMPASGSLSEEQRLFFGGMMTQTISDAVAVWLGAGLSNHQYSASAIRPVVVESPVPSPAYNFNRLYDNNVYNFYLGARANITNNIMIQADYVYEMSDVLKAMNSKYDQNHYAQLWLNIGF